MAKELGDDQERLEEVRNEIRSLQSQYAKKKEDKEKRDKDLKDQDKQIVDTEDKLKSLELEIERQQNRAQRDRDSQHGMQNQAKNDFMYKEVHKLLQERIPILSNGREEGEEGDKTGGGEKRDEEPGKAQLHDVVLVSYVNVDRIQEDYKVSYRIDKDTTVEQLHKDACAYWGCSHKEYRLCRISYKNGEEPQPSLLWEKHSDTAAKNKKLQSEDVLNPAQESHLHLVKLEDFQKWKKATQNVKKDPKEQEVKIPGVDSMNALKTMKYGLSSPVLENIMEPFVDALKLWPGLYHLLARRKRQYEQKWKRMKLSDILVFVFLIVLSGLCLLFRDVANIYQLRNGIVQTLGAGIAGETSGHPLVQFTNMHLHDDMFKWLAGSFKHQVYNDSSTLRKYYTPVGYLRVRQQRALEQQCPDRNIPPNFRRPCYFVSVGPDVQDKGQMTTPTDGVPYQGHQRFVAGTNSGRQASPSPFIWQASEPAAADLLGFMQDSYDGAGYMIVYDLLTTTGSRFEEDLAYILGQWINIQTRMFVIELTFANYNLGGYVAASFLLEISPSGAVHPWMDVVPFGTFNTWGNSVANALDIVRWIVILGYIVLWRVYMLTSKKVAIGKRSFTYVFSFVGLVDATIVAAFLAIQVMRLKAAPPDPTQQQAFYSYSRHAHNAEMLPICEAFLLSVLLLRFATFARMTPTVYRLFKMFAKSMHIFGYFCIVFLPVLIGTSVLANAIWSPYILHFSTWTQTFLTTVIAARQSFKDTVGMMDYGRGWTIPFLIYFFLTMTAFMINAFLAITVHAYFEVELIEGSDPKNDHWSPDQWKDWALWAPVYEKVCRRKSGASRIVGYAEGEEPSDTDSSSDSDDEK